MLERDGPYHKLVRFLTRGRVLLTFIGLYLIFVIAVMPGLAGPNNNVPPIDLAFHYSVDEVYGWIEAYGAAGRERYMIGEMTFDVIYPIIYTGLFIGLIGYFVGAEDHRLHRLVFLPPVIWCFDMLENAGIVTMLRNYPEVLDTVAMLTAWATTIKWSFAGLVIAITLMLMIRKAVILARGEHHN